MISNKILLLMSKRQKTVGLCRECRVSETVVEVSRYFFGEDLYSAM